MHVYEYLVHTYVQIDPEQRMKKGMRERGVGGDGVSGCSLGKLLDNKKPIFFVTWYIKKKP